MSRRKNRQNDPALAWTCPACKRTFSRPDVHVEGSPTCLAHQNSQLAHANDLEQVDGEDAADLSLAGVVSYGPGTYRDYRIGKLVATKTASFAPFWAIAILRSLPRERAAVVIGYVVKRNDPDLQAAISCVWRLEGRSGAVVQLLSEHDLADPPEEHESVITQDFWDKLAARRDR